MTELTGMPVWRAFARLIPEKPYCSNEPREGLFIRPRETALKYSHIQVNHPHYLQWLVFDIDREDAAFAWEDANLPAPSFVAQNSSNYHAHCAYLLKCPVYLGANSPEHPTRYAMAVERGMTRRLGADPGYAGLIVKNPLSSRWRTRWLAASGYELNDLESYLTYRDMRALPRNQSEPETGRNSELFEILSNHASHEVRRSKTLGAPYSEFLTNVYNKALLVNREFSPPLSFAECRSIAKSVAQWTWKHFTAERFGAIQAHRSALAARARSICCKNTKEEIRNFICDLDPTRLNDMGLLPDMGGGSADAISAKQLIQGIVKRFDISERTAWRHLKAIKSSAANCPLMRCD